MLTLYAQLIFPKCVTNGGHLRSGSSHARLIRLAIASIRPDDPCKKLSFIEEEVNWQSKKIFTHSQYKKQLFFIYLNKTQKFSGNIFYKIPLFLVFNF